jgi:hypothetical protein
MTNHTTALQAEVLQGRLENEEKGRSGVMVCLKFWNKLCHCNEEAFILRMVTRNVCTLRKKN